MCITTFTLIHLNQLQCNQLPSQVASTPVSSLMLLCYYELLLGEPLRGLLGNKTIPQASITNCLIHLTMECGITANAQIPCQ